MKSKYIKIASSTEADQKIRPSLAHIHIEGDTISATDSFKATIVTQKEKETFPDIRKFFPVVEKESMQTIDVNLVLWILKIAKAYKPDHICFRYNDVIGVKDNKEFVISSVNTGIVTKVNLQYLYDFMNDLKNAWFTTVLYYQKEPLAPIFFVAENSEVKVEHIIMPIK